jgi:hypothetical protein
MSKAPEETPTETEPKEITSLALTPEQKKHADDLQKQIETGSDYQSKTAQNSLNTFLQSVASENEAKKKESIDLEKTVYDPKAGTMEVKEPEAEEPGTESAGQQTTTTETTGPPPQTTKTTTTET